MATYLISYDLKKGKDYPRLFDALIQLGACRALLSVWVLGSPHAPGELVEYLGQFVDRDDRVLVVALAGAWNSINLTDAELACLRARMPG